MKKRRYTNQRKQVRIQIKKEMRENDFKVDG